MLDKKVLDDFILKADNTYQQFCVWMYVNNELVKHQDDLDKIDESITKEFSGCKYKNFWEVVIFTLQQAWILGVIRLFDPPYFLMNKKKKNPRLSLYYILELLEDSNLKYLIEEEINKHKDFIESIRKQRPNLAHNEIEPTDKIIEAGIENLFGGLHNIIKQIKNKNPHLKDCNNINQEYTEKLSKCGVDEIFEALLKN